MAKAELRIWCGTWNSNLESYLILNAIWYSYVMNTHYLFGLSAFNSFDTYSRGHFQISSHFENYLLRLGIIKKNVIKYKCHLTYPNNFWLDDIRWVLLFSQRFFFNKSSDFRDIEMSQTSCDQIFNRISLKVWNVYKKNSSFLCKML